MLKMRSKTTFIVLLVLMLTLVIAVAPASADTRKITLLNAVVKEGRGNLTLTFRVEGEFENFTGNVHYSGKSYDLACHLRKTNDSILVCHGADRGLNRLAYQKVWGDVNGFGFATYVNKEFCYSVYDFMALLTDLSEDSVSRRLFFPRLEQVGNVCQNSPAVVGDRLFVENPDFGLRMYQYLESFDCSTRNNIYREDHGPAYYPFCRVF